MKIVRDALLNVLRSGVKGAKAPTLKATQGASAAPSLIARARIPRSGLDNEEYEIRQIESFLTEVVESQSVFAELSPSIRSKLVKSLLEEVKKYPEFKKDILRQFA